MYFVVQYSSKGDVFFDMHNKEYALKLVQEKLNGNNSYSYSQIGILTGYTKLQIINFSKLLKEKDIDSILVHGLTNKPSNNSPSPKEIEYIRNFKKQYPIREPSPRRGILIMIDGTPHDWFQNGRKSSLHLAIDDATGEALCGWFMPTECLEGYVRLLEILVTKYGIPENIYCDKHTILISPIDGNLTNFGHMCEDLGINIIAANTPQAKGKVEKWNNTIQNR